MFYNEDPLDTRSLSMAGAGVAGLGMFLLGVTPIGAGSNMIRPWDLDAALTADVNADLGGTCEYDLEV